MDIKEFLMFKGTFTRKDKENCQIEKHLQQIKNYWYYRVWLGYAKQVEKFLQET